MNNNYRVRVTVLKRTVMEDFCRAYCESIWEPCERLQEGQEFISDGVNMPEGFCSWAWCDIQKYVMTIARGGNFRGVRRGHYTTCCTDGQRPVFFSVDRIDPDQG